MANQKLRHLVLFFFFALFSFVSIRHFIYGGAESASVHALCPFGAFEGILYYFQTGTFIPQVLISSFILAGALMVVILLFKRSFCGWVCPFGAVQEALGRIKKKKLEVPEKIDKSTRYLKYLILFLVILTSTVYGSLIFTKYDPFATFFHFGKGVLWNVDAGEFFEHLLPFTLTLIVLFLSVFIERFWCKYLCPLGAVEALLSKFGLRKLTRSETCINCNICDKKCPVGVNISTVNEVKSAECIDCGICVDRCPANSMSYMVGKKKISTKGIGVISILIILGTFGVAKLIGVWQSVPTIEDYVVGKAERIEPENIKGWMTIRDISEVSGIESSQLIADLKLPSDIDLDLPVNQVKEVYNYDFHTSVIRDYVSACYEEDVEIQEELESKTPCPWGLKNDPAPGACGIYTDSDNNHICDYSE